MNDEVKAKILIQALPYIKKFKDKVIVVKYGGNAMINEEIKNNVIKDLIFMKYIGINVVLVHGGGPEITNMLSKLNIESKFVNGLRYTDDSVIDVVKMVLGGKINKEIVSLLQQFGEKAIGLTGIDGCMLKAVPVSEDLGYTGKITSIDVTIINDLLNLGYIPVIASIATNEDNTVMYNINADTCASKIASSLKAEKLILLTDVDGVYLNKDDNSSLLSVIRLYEIPRYEQDQIIKGGMIPKIKCCEEAVRNGVKSAHIINGTTPNSILLELLSDEGTGTMIY